ncbi:hypothetical protein B0H19DRAFT_1097289 [Mycena capillaripes]|nr:hypothetical protein B0H19DRAFT_1097193 [Mycena capillaripes]KAJ6594959.1 hypothetical protein B0H19DRAFT_1097289 [Mycena capillaripes]
MESIRVIIVVVGIGRVICGEALAPCLHPRPLYYLLIAASIRRPSSVLLLTSSCNEMWQKFWLMSLHPSDDFNHQPMQFIV